MNGKWLAGGIVAVSLIAGAAIYYLQVYGYYREVPATGAQDVQLVALDGGGTEPVPHSGFRAIDADSSPIRFRACFETTLDIDEARARYVELTGVPPRNAPGWFDCFDAAGIGKALEDGRAATFLSVKNIAYGVDRVVAITRDGRGYIWHTLNDCGEKNYDGTPVGEACPPRPDTGG